MKTGNKILLIVLLLIAIRFFSGLFDLSHKYYDVFVPLLPFATILKSNIYLVLFYIFIAIISSIVHYDEAFAIGLGYGISLLLLITFSRKYSLVNLFNYLVSVLIISTIVFAIMTIVYFIKDEIIVLREYYQFASVNMLISIFYYIFYRIIAIRSFEYVKG
jgi:hypothetical protein